MNTKALRQKRKIRIRTRISGTGSKPRLSVTKSNKYIYAQLINDEVGKTVASASSLKLKETGMKAAEVVGKKIAQDIVKLKLDGIVFDRNGNKYHGRVKVLAESLRAAGIKF